MASRLSQEEENYVRMSLLLTGISPRAARALFDREFAPSCLDSSLKREYNKLRDLQKKRIITQSQWNLLFPRFPDVPDSKTFDVTLMITLLRHLTDPKDLVPPRGGYDRLPSVNETTPTSDLARIKFYRNFIAHLDEGKIENTEFMAAWDIVTDAIGRLGGQLMKQECDNLKVKILDQSNQEIILDIKRSNDEIMELKRSVDCLKKANEDMAIEVTKLKMSHEDTVPWNIRAQIDEIIVEWKDNDRMFIPNRAAKHVLKCIRENSCVTITASSGVGKTAILRHVALQMATEGYDILLVTDPGDIVKFHNQTKKTLFVIDDLYGNYSLNQNDIKVWEPFIERIKKIVSNKLSKIIVACRLQVYKDDKFKSLSVFKSCVCNLLSESLCLLEAEKCSIAEFYLKTKAPEIKDYYDVYDCFPLLCKLYHDNPALNITDFFQNPFTVYESEIDNLQKKGFYSKYCALALCVIFNNNLHEGILTEEVNEYTRAIIENTCEACRLDKGTSRLTLQDDLNSFIHTFLKKKQNIYTTIHDKIFDFLVYYFGQKMICCLIKNAQSGLIRERFLSERQTNMYKFVTIVPPKYHQMYTERMIEDWSNGKVNDVFCNINMKIPQFRTKFLRCLNELDTLYQRQLAHTCDVYNDHTALLMLCFIGDIPMIHWCLNLDVDVNQCRYSYISSYISSSPLEVAVNEGFTEIVRMLLDKGADYNISDTDWRTPVIIACKSGHTEIVRMLLDRGADYNKCNIYGLSPLMIACSYRHAEIVRILLDMGADYNKCDSDSQSPLVIACSVGHPEIVKMLLDIGANYKKCGRNGWSPVMYACRYEHTEIVRMLLKIGADYNKCDMKGWSPVMSVCSVGNQEIVRMLLDIGADYNKCNDNGWSPVKIASRYGHTEIVKMLLEIGANYDKCDYNGWSPLMNACSLGHSEIVRMLINIGADCNAGNNNGLDGWSPVMSACTEGHIDILRMLLEIRADSNKCDSNGCTPLMHACSKGYLEIVRMLLEISVDYNKCDYYGCSPVKVASRYGHTEIVRILLDIGADFNKCNNNGWSPVMIASRYGHTEIVRMLLNKGADYNRCHDDGWSPLTLGCRYGHTEIVRMVLNIGVDYNKCDIYGWYPLMSVCSIGHPEIVRILLDFGADYNRCNNTGCSPVWIACSVGNTTIVKMLLDKGADCNKCDNIGCSPVMVASGYGHTDIVKMLLNKGADYNNGDNNGRSLLIIASRYGHKEIVRMLLDKGADYNKCDMYGWSSVLCACIDGYTEIVRMLLDKGAEYDKCNINGCSTVMITCEYGHIEIVKMLLDKGADYNKSDIFGCSPVMCACIEGHSEIVRMLLDKGADYNKSDIYGCSPVMCACIEGHSEIVRMLLDIGAEYDKCKNDGWSPLMNACRYGHTKIVRMLLEKGADCNKSSNDGWSPVMEASRKGHTEIVNIMLDTEADYNKCSNDGWSPVMCACNEGHAEILRLLLDRGAEYDTCRKYGWSFLIKACRYGGKEIVRILLDIGSDFNICDNDGWFPLMKACRYGHTEIVRMLLDIGADFNNCNQYGCSSAIVACRHGQTNIVRMLLDIGADFNKCDNYGWSSLMEARKYGHTDIVRMLLDIESDYNIWNDHSRSAVIIASERGHRDTASKIKEHSKNEREKQEEMLISGSFSNVPNKKRTLKDLFRPPIDIAFKGTFANLRDEGKTRSKWLLVNVQNVQEFVCHELNRDVWSNRNAKAVIKDNFFFWQVYHDSEEGKKFCQFYKVNQWPYVSVVDPRTGENMSTWNKLDATVFCELATDFLMEHPYNDPSEEPSPAAKRVRGEPSIVDATEDEQLQAAIQASINQNKVPQTVIIDSDSDSNDIETFSSSEDEVSQSPLKSSPNVKSTKSAKEKLIDNKTNTDSASNMSNDQDLKNDSVNNISNLSESDSSMLNNTGSSDNHCLSEDRNYKHFLGKDTDPQTSLMIRFPDGNRQQLAVSRKSKLMALVLYVAENGFSNERYELVTNFPRRKLSYMDFELTLEDAGLYPQESVFVQAR